ncbi:MAG: hypothetical protein RMM06_05225 [Armatimonadota bacterium]|nr:hypothetical protein [Armatimonadota bacterium]MDW8290102.1 hypothetical protein [Armatimonadota bacterium]
MSNFPVTRRQFHLALFGSALALAVPNAAQPEPPAAPVASAVADLINAMLPAPMPPEQAKRVSETVQSLRKTAEALRSHLLPEGSEPALLFQPLPVRRARR